MSHTAYAERHYSELARQAQELATAHRQLFDEMAEAIEQNPCREIRTPAWSKHLNPAHELVALELTHNALAVTQLLRDAMAGRDVRTQAQLLVTLICNGHARNHCDSELE